MPIQIAENQIKNSAVTNDKLAGSITSAKIDLTGVFNFSSGTLRSGSPSGDNDVAIKSYVDAVAGGGVYWKEPVRGATTGNIDLSADLQNGDTIDGLTLVTGQRILVKDQSTQSQNGIYVVVASGTATRSTDCDSADELNGAAVFCKEGSSNADQGFIQTSEISNLGSDNIVWVQFTGLGQITAGSGLTKTGNTINVAVDDSSIEISGDALQVKASGITNTMLSGGVENNKLQNSTISGVALGNNLSSLAAATNGGVTFTSYNGSAGVSNLKLDITDLADGTIDLTGDFFAFADATDGASKTESFADLFSAVAGDALGQNASSKALEVKVDGSSIEINSDALRVKASGITNAMLSGGVENNKLQNSTISGIALGSNLNSLSASATGGIVMTSYNGSAAVSNIQLDLNSLSAASVNVAADSIAIYDADADETGKESIADVMTAVAGAALGASSGVLAVSVDDSSIEISSDALRVKASGITNAMISGSVQTSKLLLKSVWKHLSPDGASAQFDLDEALSANLTSIFVVRNGLVVKQVSSSPSGTDEYTVSASGGSGGVGRITFGSNISSSDDLRVFYVA